jgi:hypothetical protein
LSVQYCTPFAAPGLAAYAYHLLRLGSHWASAMGLSSNPQSDALLDFQYRPDSRAPSHSVGRATVGKHWIFNRAASHVDRRTAPPLQGCPSRSRLEDRWKRLRKTTEESGQDRIRCSTPEPSTHVSCLADFSITTSEFGFSVHTQSASWPFKSALPRRVGRPHGVPAQSGTRAPGSTHAAGLRAVVAIEGALLVLRVFDVPTRS